MNISNAIATFGIASISVNTLAFAQEKVEKPNILLAISDDQSWCDAGAYENRVIKTPGFDKIAQEGILFSHAYCAVPSCTPSRAAILTGQEIWRLEEGGQLFGTLPSKYSTYTRLLEENGYKVGFTRKGWGPGNFKAGGHEHNPAGFRYESFQSFIDSVPEGTPWCFWFGTYDAHRPYEKGSGSAAGIPADSISVPKFLPDISEVRSDLADYYFEIQRFDSELNEMLEILENRNHYENTLIIVTSDNGMPFPRCKATLYDHGVRVPLAICWDNKIKGGRTTDDFVSLTDIAPTILEAAGIQVPDEMTGKSLIKILRSERSGPVSTERDFICAGRERHAWCRKNGAGYGSRMIRTKEFLYIRNYNPARWPAGIPTIITNEGSFGDIDYSPTKEYLVNNLSNPQMLIYFQLSFAKRPPEELYDCQSDPDQIYNIAYKEEYGEIKEVLSKKLTGYLVQTKDPRETSGPVKWDDYLYYGRHDWKTNPGR